MLVRIVIILVGLALAVYGAYVLLDDGKVVRIEAPKVSVDKNSDSASVTIEKPKVTV